MIKGFIQRIFSRRRAQVAVPATAAVIDPKLIKPRIVDAAAYNISARMISRGARETCEGLQRAGYRAFVVGGAVRDLLLDAHPKDFDVATDATPEQVRDVFRRARIIGRRFRLVHVMFGPETIEVSTFRGHFDQRPEQRAEAEDDDDGRDSTDSHGRVLSDNVFGTQAEDAVRRDFTVNALFYDPVAEQIWDYQNGLADIQTKTLRMIGDPAVRYREDPVRMLRAARLSAKTSFTIDPATAAPIDEMKALLGNVPQARLFDEILKVLLSGHSLVCVLQLRALGLHHGLLPLLDAAFDDDASRPFAEAALRATDNRLREDKSVNPAFVLAALLWGQVEKRMRSLTSKGLKEVPALHEAMHEALDVQRSTLAIPRRYDAIIKEIWLMQPRFLRRNGGTPFRLVDHPRWRAAYDFFWLRSTVGNADPELAQWWSDFAESDEHARQSMVTAIASASRGKPQQRGVKTPSAPVTAAPDRKDAELTSNEDDADLDEGFEGASNEPGPAKRKRRRGGRRRGSSGRGGSVGPSDSGGTSGGPPASPAA